jgi:hypothetical protein
MRLHIGQTTGRPLANGFQFKYRRGLQVLLSVEDAFEAYVLSAQYHALHRSDRVAHRTPVVNYLKHHGLHY